jgi:xylulokinase
MHRGIDSMFLGIDLGTSEIKALLMDEAGHAVGVSHHALTVSRPQPRWSEQSPEEWWQGTLRAVDQLRERHPGELAAVRGIGLSGQMHGATLLDRADRPLRAAILWNDTRSDVQCRELMEKRPELPEVAGNLAMPGFTAPKLLWVAQHEPHLFKRTHSVLLPKDYLRLCLSGEKASDLSDASGTLWLDVAARNWSDNLLQATSLTRAHMPRLVEGNAVSGQLRRELAERWGMKRPAIIAGGAGDNAASAVGIGAVSPGDAFLSLGTSGVIFVVDEGFRPNPASAVHAFCHTLPKRWHRMSVMLSAASCVNWAATLVGAKGVQTYLADIAAIDDKGKQQAPLFLPYLSGERTPHNNPFAQGVFFGLTHDTTQRALGYAVLEGVTFGLVDGLTALQGTLDSVRLLSLVGGGARSAFWAQLIADGLQVPIHTHPQGEAGAAVGAARLAQLACGANESDACRKPDIQAEYQPQAASMAILGERLKRFRELYSELKPLFRVTH